MRPRKLWIRSSRDCLSAHPYPQPARLRSVRLGAPVLNARSLRTRLAVASSLVAAALTVALVGIMGTAGPAAAAPTAPPFPAACVSGQTTIAPGNGPQQFGTYPNWLPCSASVSNVDHSEGSDATLYVLQAISDLYAQGGIMPFSCTLSPTNNSTCSSANPNATQADLFDNYAATEQLQGINFIGSSNGIAELCGTGPNAPPGTTVDYARSSKPPGQGNACGTGFIQAIGYAKDAVDPIDFPTIVPQAYMQSGDEAPGYVGQSFVSYCQTTIQPGCSTVGQTLTTPFPTATQNGGEGAGIGPVADGWLPGDPFNCGTGGGVACSGTPFENLTNTADSSSTNGTATSVAYRLFCQHGSSTTPYESQIMDWGNLTNLSAANNGGTAVQPGDGAPIGVPIRIIGVSTASGTLSTFYTFAQSGITGGANCKGNSAGNPLSGTSGNVDVNAAQGQNPQSPQGPAGGVGNTELALESDPNQIGDFAEATWAGVAPAGAGNADSADQAIDIATSLYFESLGIYSTNPNAQVTNIEIPTGDTAGGLNGQPGTFLANPMEANGVQASLVNELQNNYAMARTLFNVLRTDMLRASTAGFTNWLCDSNSAFQKGEDHIDGGNFNTDLTNLILGQYGFQRLTDLTTELNVTKTNALADGIAGNNNGFCQGNLKISSTGGVGTNTITLAAAAPGTVQVGWPVAIQVGSGIALPPGGSGGNVVLSVSTTSVTIGDTTPTVGGVLQSAVTTTVASGSNGGTLANIASWSSPSAGDLNVGSTTGFGTSGVADVATSGGNAFVSYTGTDATDLTGVTFLSQSSPGAATTVSTGGAVTLLRAQNFVTGTSGGPTPASLYFPGKPPILAVTTPNT